MESVTIHRGHAAGNTPIEKKASQLVSDIKYKVNKELGPNTKLNPAQVAQKYIEKLSASPAPPPVKSLARKKLMGEEYISDIKKLVQSSLVEACSQVFAESNQEKRDRVWIVVRDKKTRNTYRRSLNPEIARQEVSKLRANPNISSVEYTNYRSSEDDAYKQGKRTASVKAGKGLDPVGSEDADVNNDGKVNKTDKYLQNRRNVRGSAIAAKSGVAEEFIGEVKKPTRSKTVTGKGVNNSAIIKVFPTVKEQMVGNISNPSQQKTSLTQSQPKPQNQSAINAVLLARQKVDSAQKDLANKQRMAAQKKVDLQSLSSSYEFEGQDLSEKSLSVSQQQAAGAALSAKRGEIDPSELKGASLEMYNTMTEKQLRDFAKTKHKGLPEKVDESNCGCDEKEPTKNKKGMIDDSDLRSRKTSMDLIRTRLGSMGLKMSYEPEGEIVSEEESDRMRDREQERAGMDRPSRYSGGRNPNNSSTVTGPKKKPEVKDVHSAAMAAVRASIEKKYGKGSLM